MDIDVKVALDRLMSACKSIEAAESKDSHYQNISEIVVREIFTFIHFILFIN